MSFPQKVVIDKTEIVSETEVANEFNNFFTNIGPKLVQKKPATIKTFWKLYKQSKIWNGVTNPLVSMKLSTLWKLIKVLAVTTLLAKTCFNLSSSSGIFPDSLKIGKVTPICKASNSNDLGNYRPISVFYVFLRCSNV